MQFRDGAFRVSQGCADGSGEGTQDEAFAAEPLQPFEDGVSFVGSAGLGQGISINGYSGIKIGRLSDQILRDSDGAIRTTVERENDCSVDVRALVVGKDVECVICLLQAFRRFSRQVIGPCEASVQPRRVRIYVQRFVSNSMASRKRWRLNSNRERWRVIDVS